MAKNNLTSPHLTSPHLTNAIVTALGKVIKMMGQVDFERINLLYSLHVSLR